MLSSMKGLRLNLPGVQNFLAGCVLFATVGIYIAITALGAGGGKADSTEMNYIVSSVLYGCFAIFGFFGGSVINKFGPKWSIVFGAAGYPFYVSGLFYFDRKDALAYPAVGGAVAGICGSQLWAGVNYIALVYADENSKGRFYATQAAMKAAGNLVASSLVLGINSQNRTSNGVPTAVYVAFICLMCSAVVIALFLVKPENVRRRDGTAIAIFERSSFIEEFKAVAKLVFDPKAMLLVPCLIVAEFQLSLQPGISARYFNLRARSLGIFVAALIEVIGTFSFGFLLDTPAWSRPTRAKVGVAAIALLIVGVYCGEAGWLFGVIPAKEPESVPAYDWTNPRFAGFFVIFVLFNLLGAVAPVYIAWLLSSLTNDPQRSGAYAGLLRSVMAAGTAIGFGIAAGGVSYRNQFIVHIVCQFLAIIPQAWVAFKYVTPTNYGMEEMVIIPESARDIVEGIDLEKPRARPETKATSS